jgi:glycosyltransferase involved in cell wall biosynthesis
MNLFVPDARIGWYPYAVSRGKKLLQSTKYDAIITIGPPHSTHLIGMKLSKYFNIPFYPVFIDPWVDIIYYKNFKRNKLTLAIDNYLERKVLEHSAKTIFVTGSMKEDYQKKYVFVKDKSEVLYWGYNEDDFSSLIKKSGGETKTILHAGNIFDYQNVIPFWSQIKKEIDNGNKLKIKFIGTVSNQIKQSINDEGLNEHVEYIGFIPYSQVPQEMLNADYLLVSATEKRHLPGKLFEYLRTGNPIIAFGDDNEEIDKILRSTNAGRLYKYSDSASDFFISAQKFETNLEVVNSFNREFIASSLARILHESVRP